MEQKDQQILFELGPDILSELNIEAVQPFLSKHGLTSTEELEILLNDSVTATVKKKKLIYSWLPHKGDDSLSRFIEALKESGEGTTHNKLAMRLQAKRTGGRDCVHCWIDHEIMILCVVCVHIRTCIYTEHMYMSVCEITFET